MYQDEILTSQSPDSLIKDSAIASAPQPDLVKYTSLVNDLQTPLLSLTRFTGLLLEEYQEVLDEQGKQYLQEISVSSSRLKCLIDDILAYSQAATDNQTWIKVDLNQVLNTVCSNLRPKIKQTQAEITIAPLPHLLINPQEIQQLFHNLLDNALQYSGQDSPKIKIAVTAQNNQWLFEVKDQGVGVNPQFQEQIFEVFYRLNSGTNHSGSGMGLAICRKIVHRYGGHIWLESQLGSGATFYFTLPQSINPQMELASIE